MLAKMAALGGSEEEAVLIACLDELMKEHDKDTIRIALETLLKITNNVIQHPNEEKYKKIKTENKNFKSKVWSVPEAQQFLMVCGWIETDDVVMLQGDIDMNVVKHVLQNKLSSVQSRKEEEHSLTEKEKALKEERRLLIEKAKLEKQEKERIKAQIRADRENIKARELHDSKATAMHGDGQMTKFKDIGVDLGEGSGGGG